jgi:hypothetical protein
MTSEVVHPEWHETLPAGPPEMLSPDDVEAMLRHADACPACAPALRDSAALALTTQAPPVAMDPERSERLRVRILAAAARTGRPAESRAPRTRRPALAAWSGWLATAAMGVGLLTHHAFHEPLDGGWLVAAAFALLSLVLGTYALSLRRRVAARETSTDRG